jgi:hypothetical protein
MASPRLRAVSTLAPPNAARSHRTASSPANVCTAPVPLPRSATNHGYAPAALAPLSSFLSFVRRVIVVIVLVCVAPALTPIPQRSGLRGVV